MPNASLVKYIETLTGSRPALEDVPKHETANLPLFLRDRYKFFQTFIFGKRLYFALEKTSPGDLSPTQYAREAALLKQQLSADVILIIAKLPPYIRNRFVKQGVPFIVPGTQMFLPMLMIDLREHFAKVDGQIQDKLSPVSQLVVIYHILKKPGSQEPLGRLAERLGYSAMAMSKAQNELQRAELCEVVHAGRAILLQFKLCGRELWEKAEPLMSTPVKRTQWVRWGQPRARAVTAGATALSEASMVTDEQIPTYAMRDKDFKDALSKGEMFVCEGREEAEAQMEVWKYDPWLVAENGSADRCSLYLSLRNSADERVQKGIRFLIEGLPR
jgi:DNA-binding MarR family transcriptional regulator